MNPIVSRKKVEKHLSRKRLQNVIEQSLRNTLKQKEKKD